MKRRFWRIAGAAALVLLGVLAFCGYRSPQTNAALRRHSSGVARAQRGSVGW